MPLTTCDRCIYAKDGICTRHTPSIGWKAVTNPDRLLTCSLQPDLPASRQCGDGEAMPEATADPGPSICKWCDREIYRDLDLRWRDNWRSTYCNRNAEGLVLAHEPREVKP